MGVKPLRRSERGRHVPMKLGYAQLKRPLRQAISLASWGGLRQGKAEKMPHATILNGAGDLRGGGDTALAING